MLVIVSMVCAEEALKTEDMSLPPVLADKTSSPGSYQYGNRMVVFHIFRLNYERIKPNALYVGADAWFTWAMRSPSSDYHTNNIGFIGEAEFRLGYNFLFNGKNHLTPLIGTGVFKDCGPSLHKKKVTRTNYRYNRSFPIKTLVYGTFGFLYDHEFNSIFNLGLNLKAIVGGDIGGARWRRWGNPVLGFDVTLPITFRFGRERHWDFRFEPFDIFLNGRRFDMNYFGFRTAFGYRF